MGKESDASERLRQKMLEQVEEMGRTAENGNEDKRMETLHYLGEAAIDASTGNDQ